jgi:predicted membrane protein
MTDPAGFIILRPGGERTMNEPNPHNKTRMHDGQRDSRIALGIIVLLIGGLMLLGNLGFFYYNGNLFKFWPVIIIGIGLARIFDAPAAQGKFWGVFITGIGTIFLLNNLDFLQWNLSHLLVPFILICLGVAILLRGFQNRRPMADPHPINPVNPADEEAPKYTSTTTDNILHADVLFGGINRRIQSQDFQGGKTAAVFGGVEIDLRESSTTRDEIHIEANAIFGGVELKVPEAWDVVVRGTGVLGGYEDKTHRSPVSMPGVRRPRLIIDGSAVFGGVSVRN